MKATSVPAVASHTAGNNDQTPPPLMAPTECKRSFARPCNCNLA